MSTTFQSDYKLHPLICYLQAMPGKEKARRSRTADSVLLCPRRSSQVSTTHADFQKAQRRYKLGQGQRSQPGTKTVHVRDYQQHCLPKHRWQRASLECCRRRCSSAASKFEGLSETATSYQGKTATRAKSAKPAHSVIRATAPFVERSVTHSDYQKWEITPSKPTTCTSIGGDSKSNLSRQKLNVSKSMTANGIKRDKQHLNLLTSGLSEQLTGISTYQADFNPRKHCKVHFH